MSNTGSPSILILGRDTCEDSIRSRAHLGAHGIAYTYRNVEIDPDADALNRSYNGGVRVTPTILIGDPDRPTRVIVEPSDTELDAAIDLG
jgi:glutaredoxin